MRTNAEWKSWGARDPLFAVASKEGKEATGATPWTAEEFLAMGAADFADVRRHWEHYGLRPGRCVEIGSGSGRMTMQLANIFQSVLALEVSEHQIARAKQLLGPDVGNVDYQLIDEPVVPAADASCDAMFTCHVFQHLPGMDGIAAYLRETFRVLCSKGTICFHVPVPGAHLGSRKSDLWYGAWNIYTMIRRLLGSLNIAEYHRYPASTVITLLSDLGFSDVELRIFAMSSNRDYHSYFFARKP